MNNILELFTKYNIFDTYSNDKAVYIICDHNNIPLYCGQSKCVQNRVNFHIEKLNKYNRFGNRYAYSTIEELIVSNSEFNSFWSVYVCYLTNSSESQREQFELYTHEWFDTLLSTGGHAFTGRTHTDKTKRLISEALNGHTNIDGEKNPNWKIDPWLHSRSTPISLLSWKYMPILYDIWIKNPLKDWKFLRNAIQEVYGIELKSQLGNMVHHHFKLGCDHMEELLKSHAIVDFDYLIFKKSPRLYNE